MAQKTSKTSADVRGIAERNEAEAKTKKEKVPEVVTQTRTEETPRDAPSNIDLGQEKIEVETAEPQGFSVRAPRRVSKKARMEQAATTTAVIITLIDGMAATYFGEGAHMTDAEREMIAGPMTRCIARLDPMRSEVIEKWSDPILLTYGLIAWLGRIWSEKKEEEPVVNSKTSDLPGWTVSPNSQEKTLGADPDLMDAVVSK